MATQIKSRVAPDDLAGSKIDRYVDQQLKRTSQQVRISDFITGVLAVISFALAFFMLAAIVDAWLWSLTPFARAAALTLFVVGSGTIFWFALWPLFVRRINPQYAAKMIEDARPGFKNSLLNHLALKRDARPVHRAILNEVSKRAATDLSHVHIDSTVDKSNLIRFGFVLVGLVALSIGYLIFSPKSPLPTVMRVLAPGARIERPAAVMIQNVTPGDTAIFFGDRLEITAQITGNHDADEVRLVYSAQDGQIVEAAMPMQYSGSSGVYSAILETGPAGIQQPLHYFIAARDGISPTFAIDVRPNPSISIHSIAITPPKYTKLPARAIEGYGEIKAVEGSQIEIKATANLPIDVAYIVPLVANDEAVDNGEYRELRAIPMKSDGNQASGQFVAALNSNRSRPLFTHYKLKFRSTSNFQNDQANVYAIRVIADLAPQVEIVQPAQKEIAIPVNQPFPVEVWASDLDYEISAIDLHIDHQGTRVLDRSLELEIDGQNQGGRVVTGLRLTPAELSLEPGDKAIIFATASDNRVSPGSDLPDPNISRTENYTLLVTEPIENPEQPKTQPEGDKKNQEQDSAQKQEGTGETGSSDETQGESGEESGDAGGNATDSSSDKPDESGDESQGSSKPGESGQDSKTSGEPDSNQTGGEESGNQDGAGNESDGNESGEEQNPGSQSQNQSNPAGQQRDGVENGQENGDANQNSDGTTAGTEGQESGGSGEQGSPTRQNGENSSGEADGSEFRDDQLQNGDSQPLDKNATDSERFERLKEYFEKQQGNQQNKPADRASDQATDQNSPELQEGGEQTKPAEDSSDKPADEHQSTDSDASMADQPATQRLENPDPQPGSQPPKINDSDQARDGKSDQQGPDSDESENGEPDASEQGAGAQSEKDQQRSKPIDSNTEVSEEPEPKQDGNSQSPSESSQRSTQSDSTSEQQADSQGGNQKSESTNQQSESSTGEGEESTGDSPSTGNSAPSESTGEPAANREASSKPNPASSSEPGNETSGSESELDSKSPQPNSDTQPGGAGGDVESQRNSKSSVEDNPNPDKANLDYARQVTDLVLDNLEDQQYDPDQELLDQMNWTAQDLDKFLKSWQMMKNNAKTGDLNAQQEYVEALQSLGLDRNPKGRQVNSEKDDLFQLNEDGAIDQIPAEYVDPFNSYLKRRNRSKRN